MSNVEEQVSIKRDGRVIEEWDGAQLLAALQSAARWLEQHVDVVNALNVFPVPDGDTGTNMSLTVHGALEGVNADPSCAVVADRVRYWATMRGRGNSGIILSQVLRGMAQGLAGHTQMRAATLAAALTQANVAAYQAVMKPVEGTMLTVIREASEAAQAALGEGATVTTVLAAATRGAQESVEWTPTHLKLLRDAGVVDAGGRGLALIFEGMLRYAHGEAINELKPPVAQPREIAFTDIHGPDDFGYCTNFVLQSDAMPYDAIRTTIAGMGQSVVVVGDPQLIKVHLHTLRPGEALNYAVQFGALSQIEITNMDLQRETLQDGRRETEDERRAMALKTATSTHEDIVASNGSVATLNLSSSVVRLPSITPAQPSITDIGVVAVAPGEGFASIFRSLHAQIVTGGQMMNPSTADILAAIDLAPQDAVIVLPNTGNILLTARQAAQLSDKRIEVIPSRTAPQGIAALLAFNYQADLADNVQAMEAALRQVRTAEITRAVRDATVDGVAVRAGQTIGLLDGTLTVADDQADVVIDALLDGLALDTREIVTIYYGQAVCAAAAETLAARIGAHYPDIEVEVQEGGQALYDYILSVE
jgi:DAK2 domain fusion protein YloV